MSQQPAEEHEDMDAKTEQHCKDRLAAACDTKAEAPTHRHIVMRPGGRLVNMPGI